MWAVVMFDLPTKTKKQRHEYTEFRKGLRQLGLGMMQYSVYARYYPLGQSHKHLLTYLETRCPPGGKVTLLLISDTAWAKAFRFSGDGYKPDPEPPDQLMLF